ncbi:MAG: hypothetical protein ACK4MT_08955 [Thermaurantiacus tibetensis]|uniref:hypothetical protein n=1 Tax=Thermaurantiacus tibetensis TaxID=2759035 RepID=UPI00188E35A6|nr:hypothetical protein [Thermaurantiacus tibetensis]
MRTALDDDETRGAVPGARRNVDTILIDPKAELVIPRFASQPLAGNRNLHPTSLPASDAIASHLSAR